MNSFLFESRKLEASCLLIEERETTLEESMGIMKNYYHKKTYSPQDGLDKFIFGVSQFPFDFDLCVIEVDSVSGVVENRWFMRDL